MCGNTNAASGWRRHRRVPRHEPRVRLWRLADERAHADRVGVALERRPWRARGGGAAPREEAARHEHRCGDDRAGVRVGPPRRSRSRRRRAVRRSRRRRRRSSPSPPNPSSPIRWTKAPPPRTHLQQPAPVEIEGIIFDLDGTSLTTRAPAPLYLRCHSQTRQQFSWSCIADRRHQARGLEPQNCGGCRPCKELTPRSNTPRSTSRRSTRCTPRLRRGPAHCRCSRRSPRPASRWRSPRPRRVRPSTRR